MKRIIRWSEWSIATKILFTFLSLIVISMSILAYISLTNIRDLGNYALATSSLLGERAITDSTNHLNKLGEEMINQKARDIGMIVEMYLADKPGMTVEAMRADQELRRLVVQPVGTTGYTTLIDPANNVIIIHKFPGQEKHLNSLQDYLPSFWELLITSRESPVSNGYYDWQEVDGSIRQKYAGIFNISNDGNQLSLWATTYIDEFSLPASETANEINAAIRENSNYISDSVIRIQDAFIVTFTALVFAVIGLALLLSWLITSPITALKRGAEAIGKGKLEYQIPVKSKDELGQLASSFNRMGSDLKRYTEEIKNSAEENLSKERKIQENLRVYVQRVSQAQESERKRIARELHDETAQALVVVLRQLDDLASGKSKKTANDIREEVKKILEGVRHFSQELRPSILDNLGLVPALNWLTADLTNTYGIKAGMEVSGDQFKLPPDTELTLFRITQEALTNVRKHSEAGSVNIKVNFSEKLVTLSIADDGKGFEKPSRIGDLATTGKLGLLGMQERVQLIDGKIAVESRPGKGTTITVEVPVKES